jgi:hypothetical protein
MTNRIENAIQELVKALREESDEQIVSFNLFVNCQEYDVETKRRTPVQLKDQGISMRNLRGNFIKPVDSWS